jgi:integrase
MEGCELMRERTIEDHVRSWLRIICARYDKAGVLIKEKGVRGGRADIPRITAEVALDPKVWEKFRAGWMLGVNGKNPRKVISAKTSIAAYYGHARSMFSDKFMPLYAGLKLPDLRPMRELDAPKVSPDAYQFQAISAEKVNALEAEILALRSRFEERDEGSELTRAATDARGIYLGFFLCYWLGMRQGDVANARLEWIDNAGTIPQMSIKIRDYYIPKGTIGDVSIDAKLLADIRELSGARFPLDYLIPGPNRNGTLRKLSKIIRKYVGTDRKGTQHELRKQAISIYCMKHGWEEAVRFARHRDIRVLRKHYQAYLKPLAPISSSDWRENVVPISAAR